jgi:flagellar basal-body rod protein FlgG
MSDIILDIGKSGLETGDAKIKVLMDNIVNSQTPGFKKSDVIVKSFPAALDNATSKLNSAQSMMPKVDGVYQNHQQGALLKTGGQTDVAIGGKGYFVLQTENGEVFTRDGRFSVSPDGSLVSLAGNDPVLGQSGPIVVVPGSKIDISANGDIRSDGNIVDKIRVVSFEDPSKLQSINNSRFKIPENSNFVYSEDDNPRVLQGFTETSNASMMDEMMEMINLGHVYSVDAKIVSTRDALLEKAMDLGKMQ